MEQRALGLNQRLALLLGEPHAPLITGRDAAAAENTSEMGPEVPAAPPNTRVQSADTVPQALVEDEDAARCTLASPNEDQKTIDGQGPDGVMPMVEEEGGLPTSSSVETVTLLEEAPSLYLPHPRRGELGSSTPFCPLAAACRYQQHFLASKETFRTPSAIFSDNLFWKEEWTVYYTWPPASVSQRPMLFVERRQLEHFFDQLNQSLGLMLHFDASHEELGLVAHFPRHPDLHPRILGCIDSRAAFDALERHIPNASFRPSSELPPVSAPSIAERGVSLAIGLKTQRLGRVNSFTSASTATRKEAAQKKRQAQHAALALAAHILTPAPSHSIPPWCPILISLDVEAYERDHTKLTEIGLVLFDTRTIHSIPPDNQNADAWTCQMFARHLRVREHAHLPANHIFCPGAPDSFAHGTSECVPLSDLPAALTASFTPPYLAAAPSLEQNGACSEEGGRARPVVLVGHDVGNDVRALRRVGFDLTGLLGDEPTTLDTAAMAQAAFAEATPRALGALAAELGLPPERMHNAGNDAWVALRVCVGLALRQGRAEYEDEGAPHTEAVGQREGETCKA